MPVIVALLAQGIDYAGTFPPAALALSSALKNYAEYRHGSSAWALGNFIVPAQQLAALPPGCDWPLGVIVRDDGDCECVAGLAQRQRKNLRAVECSWATLDRVQEVLQAIAPADVFVELRADEDLNVSLTYLAARGVKAKIRTGGVTASAIPSVESLARFLQSTVEHKVPFKATAGLHHLLRGTYPLTNEQHSPDGTMHGFLNVFLAAALALRGANFEELTAILEETSHKAFRFSNDHVIWRDRTFTTEEIAWMRQVAMRSFGSCSFTEPLQEISALRLAA